MQHDQLRIEESIFNEVIALPAGERKRFLVSACGDDVELRRRLKGMIDYDDQAESHDGGGERALNPIEMIEPADDIKAGAQIGPYSLIKLLGEGGFGLVFLARQESPIRREVALKIIKLGMDTRRVIARFRAERQLLAMMYHPGIARVFDAGATPHGRPFFVMELVDGRRITRYCDEQRLTIRHRLELFLKVCDAVQHAHQKGVIHRDLKPSNILVLNEDRAPKIIDFGIARATSREPGEAELTVTRQMLGTPAYMSPEQSDPMCDLIDTRTDIYSLGVVLHELLTGVTPFRVSKKSGAHGTRAGSATDQLRRPSTAIAHRLTATDNAARNRQLDERTLVRALRGDLDWIVTKALEHDPDQRYGTVAEFAADIERSLANKPVAARRGGRMYVLKKLVHRHRVVVSAGALVILAIVAGLAVAIAGMRTARHAEARALEALDLAETRLWDSLVAQARSAGSSDLPGRRHASLAAIAQAAAIRSTPELRDRAIEYMTHLDMHVERTFENAFEMSARGLARLDRYAYSPTIGEIVVASAEDGSELIRIAGPPLDVRVMRFSADGRYLAVKYHTGNDIQFIVWEFGIGNTGHPRIAPRRPVKRHGV